MYEKDFPQTNATIATLQVNQLVFSYLSVAIRAFSIITYCHLLPHSGKRLRVYTLHNSKKAVTAD
ncbi:hypothetical protein [Segatella sp.]|uniref:hypothetical protein n=1 Tax=Segatella sp. TaxID=2974253 RepID=UPI003AB970D8